MVAAAPPGFYFGALSSSRKTGPQGAFALQTKNTSAASETPFLAPKQAPACPSVCVCEPVCVSGLYCHLFPPITPPLTPRGRLDAAALAVSCPCRSVGLWVPSLTDLEGLLRSHVLDLSVAAGGVKRNSAPG